MNDEDNEQEEQEEREDEEEEEEEEEEEQEEKEQTNLLKSAVSTFLELIVIERLAVMKDSNEYEETQRKLHSIIEDMTVETLSTYRRCVDVDPLDGENDNTARTPLESSLMEHVTHNVMCMFSAYVMGIHKMLALRLAGKKPMEPLDSKIYTLEEIHGGLYSGVPLRGFLTKQVKLAVESDGERNHEFIWVRVVRSDGEDGLTGVVSVGNKEFNTGDLVDFERDEILDVWSESGDLSDVEDFDENWSLYISKFLERRGAKRLGPDQLQKLWNSLSSRERKVMKDLYDYIQREDRRDAAE